MYQEILFTIHNQKFQMSIGHQLMSTPTFCLIFIIIRTFTLSYSTSTMFNVILSLPISHIFPNSHMYKNIISSRTYLRHFTPTSLEIVNKLQIFYFFVVFCYIILFMQFFLVSLNTLFTHFNSNKFNLSVTYDRFYLFNSFSFL